MSVNLKDFVYLTDLLKILTKNSLSTNASRIKIDTGYPLYSSVTFWNDDTGIPENQHTGFIAEDETKPSILSSINLIQIGKICKKFIITTSRKTIPVRYKFTFVFGPGGILQNILRNQFEEAEESHFTEFVFQTVNISIHAQLKLRKGLIPTNEILTPSVEKSSISVEIVGAPTPTV
jgi:hypothetical protein